MENVVLIIHLVLALCLIGIVLLQRSEGGGLGLGGGGGGGVVSGRSAASALGKLTWVFAVAFIITSLTLTVLAARNSATGSVLNRLGVESSQPAQPADGGALGTDLLPPPAEGEGLVPPRAE